MQVVMDHGPVHSRVYDMILGSDISSIDWARHIQKDGYQVKLVQEPGLGRLTKLEVRKLNEVVARFRDTGDWDLVRYTHSLAEIKKNEPPPGSRIVLPLEDVLEALGMSDKAGQIEEEMRASRAISLAIHGR